MRDQLVAVKVFKVDAPPEQAEQIAEALQAVVQALPRHRGLVEFIAAGVERDTAYLVMAHSDVPSLDSRLKPGVADSSAPPVDAEQALVIVRTLAEAMDAAHARGIVHGGLHPRDIFVDDRGACRAAGFGVATALERAGVKVPVRRPYSPPERLTSAPIEPAADRFALGAIAFELLTGRRIAGTGTNAATRYNVSVPGADRDAVRNALAAMLAEQPGHRPSTANAFAVALSLALFPQGVARTSAAGAAATTAADRSPASAGRDDRRDANTAAGLGGAAGLAAGAIAAGASNLSRDADGPSPDDLELFTREGLFTGQPRQDSLRWEPVEIDNVVAPGEDPLDLFDSESKTESKAESKTESEVAPKPAVTSAAPASAAPTPAAAEASAIEVDEPPVTRPDSILGLSTTIVAPRDPEAATPAKQVASDAADVKRVAAPSARDTRDEDVEAHETTALPFVPISIKSDDRYSQPSPLSPRLHDSVLIDDNSRLDALDRVDHLDRIDHGDRLNHGDWHDRLDHLNHVDRLDVDHLDRDDDVDDGVDDGVDVDADSADNAHSAGNVDSAGDARAGESSSRTAAAAASTAGVVAAAGATSAAADLSASQTSRPSSPRADRAHADRTHSPFEREAETWVAPAAAAPVMHPSSMLTNPPETSDVGSSVRVVGLVLALGLAVGGAGGYLLGQRSSLRNASAFDQPASSDRAGAASAGNASTSGAPDASAATGAGASGGSGPASAAGKPGTARDGRNPSTSPADARPAGPRSSAGGAGSAAAPAPTASTPPAASTAPTGAPSTSGATRPAAAATGRLTINSTPARAEVAIDGVRRGVTPLTLRDLPFGSHTVRVTRGGYAPETRRVTVAAGRPAESITIELEPTAPRTRPSTPGAGPAATAAATPPERGSASGLGSLYVVSRPMGARVTVDGRLVGTTPLLVTDVTSGAHTVVLQADGHKPWQTTVQVKMGERLRVAASLEEGR